FRVCCILLCHAPAPSDIYSLSLHDALPILWLIRCRCALSSRMTSGLKYRSTGSPHSLMSCMITGRLGIVPSFSIFARYRESILRSEEHTSELQSRFDLVCRLLLEKKNSISI